MRPDGKAQITIQYKKEGKRLIPVRVHNVLVSVQFDPSVTLDVVR